MKQREYISIYLFLTFSLKINKRMELSLVNEMNRKLWSFWFYSSRFFESSSICWVFSCRIFPHYLLYMHISSFILQYFEIDPFFNYYRYYFFKMKNTQAMWHRRKQKKDVTDKKLFGVKYESNIKEWVDGFIDFLVNYDAVVPAKKLTITSVVQQQSTGR